MSAASSAKKFPYQPLADRIVVRRDPPADRCGTIHLPTRGAAALERRAVDGNPATGLAAGPGDWREVDYVKRGGIRAKKLVFRPTTLRPGDRVLLGFHPGVAVPDPEIQGATVHFIHENEIKSKLEE